MNGIEHEELKARSAADELRDLEKHAHVQALEAIANEYKSKEHLESLDRDIKRKIKRKEEFDSKLKSAVESQLDGIRNGVELLKTAESEVMSLDESFNELSSLLNRTTDLKVKIKSVKEEFQRHSRLTTAINNMSYVFNASSSIEKIYGLLDSGNDKNLLEIHQLLHDLEKSRDGLMYELHMSAGGKVSESDRQLLMDFFKDLPPIAAQLWDRIVCTFSRVPDTAVQNPRLLVTAVRLVDRQEQVDDLWRQRQLRSNFAAVGRPRCWKQKMFDAMRAAIAAKMEGSQAFESSDNEQWLEQHFLLLRGFLINDLCIARKLLVACFPPDYQIFDFYLSEYHRAVSMRLSTFATQAINNQLHYRDCVALVKWTQMFRDCFDRLGLEAFAEPKFNMEAEYQRIGLNPEFLDTAEFDQLIKHCVGLIAEHVWRWFCNAMDREKHSWYQNATSFQPETDMQTNTTYTSLVTSISAILKDMVSEVGKMLPARAKGQLNCAIMDKLSELLKSYSSSVKEYVSSVKAEQDFELKGQKVPVMERILVASLNNLYKLVMVMSEFMRSDPDVKDSDYQLESRKKTMEQRCFEVSREWFRFLGNEVVEFLDEQVFKNLYSTNWLQQLSDGQIVSESQEVLHVIKESNEIMYKDLFRTIRDKLMDSISERICIQLLRALFQQKPVLKDKCQFLADHLTKEAQQFKLGFTQLKCKCDQFTAIEQIAGLFKMTELSLVELDINNMLRNYPDLKQEQLELLLVMRGDCSRTEAKNIVAPSFTDQERNLRNSNARQLFSHVPLR